MKFPRHEASLTLQHNDHKSYYESVEEWERKMDGHYDWVSDEERRRAIETDSVWTLQWYPDTPIGSLSLAASTIKAVVAEALKVQDEEDKRSKIT